MAPTSDATNTLPSEQKYKTFGMRAGCISAHGDQNKNESIVRDVGGTVGLWTRAENDARQIVEAYCHARTEAVTDSTDYYEPCHFFYFWLGNFLKGKLLGTSDLQEVVGRAYKRLGNFQFKSGMQKRNCENLYPDISKSVFDLHKIIFDYAYNYKTLESESTGKSKFLGSGGCEKYVKEVEEAYGSSVDACESATRDKFCQELKTEYKQYFHNNNKPKWTCTTTTSQVKDSNSDDDDDDDDDFDDELFPKEFEDLHQESKLKELPSRRDYYKLFDEGMSKCDGEDWSWPNQIKGALVDDETVGERAEEIAGALCHAYAKKGKDTPSKKLTEEYCDFFYFWVGDMFWNNSRKGTFKGIMDKIGDAVGKSTSDHGCSFRFITKGLKSFGLRKLLYDYYKDHQSINSHLNLDSGEEIKCNDPYYKYFAAANKAYNYMKDKCSKGKESKSPWCTEFNIWYGDCTNVGRGNGKSHCKVAVDSLKFCTEDSKPEAVDTTSSSTANNTGSIAPGAISGGIAALGLPTIGFFLYKYTDIFDGIKKSLFGGSNRNRRRGRSTIGRQHFDDTFTGNDSSTLGDDGSTTLGGSSTDVSTIYEEPPRRSTGRGGRAGTNNRRPGNIRYYAT